MPSLQLLPTHVLLFLSALLAILITDCCGILYLLGLRKRMNSTCLRIKHGFIASVCVAIIVTGLLLVIGKPEVLGNTYFWIKMLFVAALCLNGWLIGRKIPMLSSGPFWTLEVKSRWMLALGAIMSLFFWIGAAIIGLMI